MMPQVSIILPVYNGQQFLESTIRQIIEQELEDYELLIVDDGSSDGSLEICRKFANENNRVKVFSQQNKGISSARNYAIEKANGKYITFIDQDDDIDSKLYSSMLEEASISGADIIRSGYVVYDVDSKGEIINTKEFVTDRVHIDKISLHSDFSQYRDSFQSVWNCLYRKDVIRESGVYFDEEMKFGGEDIAFNISLFPFINSVCMIDRIGYYHYKRLKTSASSNVNENRIDSIVLLNEIEKKVIRYIYHDKMLVSKWINSETISNVCLLVAILCGNSNATKEQKKKILYRVKECGSMEYSICEYIKQFGWKHKNRIIAAFLFKYKYMNLLIKMGNIRTRI